MGFFTDISNALSGNARKKYDTTHMQMLEIIDSDGNSEILYNGYTLNSNQKILSYLFINGCFNILVLSYDISNNKRDYQDSMKKASGLAQLFLEDKLKWDKADIHHTIKDVDILIYNNPNKAQDIINSGMSVVINFINNKEIVNILGYNLEMTPVNAYAILNDFFILLHNE